MKNVVRMITALFFVCLANAQKRAVPSFAVQPTTTVSPSKSHDWPRDRVFVGASYGYSTKGAFGVATSASHRLTRYVGVEGMVARYFGHNEVFTTYTIVSGPTPQGGYGIGGVSHNNPVTVRHNFFGIGPRLEYKTAFFHVIPALHQTSASASGILSDVNGVTTSSSLHSHTNAFVVSIGGGNDWRINRLLAMRTSFDYLPYSTPWFEGTSMGYKTGYQGTFVVSAGPVFTFGNDSVTLAAVAAPTSAHSAMMIPALGVVVATRQNNDGAEIVELMPGSVAELAGLRVGNVLNAVDGTPIKTPMELAVELSTKPSGSKVKIGYVTRGYWQAETALILGKE